MNRALPKTFVFVNGMFRRLLCCISCKPFQKAEKVSADNVKKLTPN